MSLIHSILNILNDKCIKQSELCAYLGINTSTMTNWKNRNTDPPSKYIIPICEFLGVSPYYLLTGKENNQSLPDDEQELLNYYKKLPERERQRLIGRAATLAEVYEEQIQRKKLISLTTNIKVYDIAAGADISTPFTDDDKYSIKEFPQTDVPSNTDCGIYINGDSMEPKYPNGCLVWVKETQEILFGDVIVAILNGAPFCKIYQEDGLHSFNEKYKPIKVTEYDNFSVFGKVIGYYVE